MPCNNFLTQIPAERRTMHVYAEWNCMAPHHGNIYAPHSSVAISVILWTGTCQRNVWGERMLYDTVRIAFHVYVCVRIRYIIFS